VSAQGKTRQAVNQGQVCCAQHNYCILQTARQSTFRLENSAWNVLASYDLKPCQYDVIIPPQFLFKIFFEIHSVSLRNFHPLSKKKVLFHCNFWKLPLCGSYLSKFNKVSSMHYSCECHWTENTQLSSALLRGTYKLQGWGGATTHPIAE